MSPKNRKEETPTTPAPVAAPASDETKAVALATIPAGGQLMTADLAAMLAEDAGAGTESMTRDDLAIPRISILQQLSPQLQKRDDAYVEGAEAGFFFDNINNSVVDGEKGIVVIPVSYRRANIEWKPRKQGGGFVHDHGIDDSILDQCTRDESTGAMLLPNGNEIVTCAEYYCLVVDPETGDCRQAVLSLAKSQLKRARRWNTMIQTKMIKLPNGKAINPAMFYCAYHLTTVPESNEKGSWFSYSIKHHCDTLELPNGSDIYLAARKFRDSVASGEVRVANPSDVAGEMEADGDDAL